MEFSNKIQQLSKSPEHRLAEKPISDELIHYKLERLDIDLWIEAETKDAGEVCFFKLKYFTEYSGEYIGVIDGLFEFAYGKPVEAIDRLGAKDLDLFLRDSPKAPAFKYYSQELYEILSIGEELKKALMPKKSAEELIFDKENTDFFELSFSEQAEVVEEIFAVTIFRKGDFDDLELDTTDDNTIVILSSGSHGDDVKLYIESSLSLYLGEVKVIIK